MSLAIFMVNFGTAHGILITLNDVLSLLSLGNRAATVSRTEQMVQKNINKRMGIH